MDFAWVSHLSLEIILCLRRAFLYASLIIDCYLFALPWGHWLSIVDSPFSVLHVSDRSSQSSSLLYAWLLSLSALGTYISANSSRVRTAENISFISMHFLALQLLGPSSSEGHDSPATPAKNFFCIIIIIFILLFLFCLIKIQASPSHPEVEV